MPDSEANTQPKEKKPYSSELSTPPPVLLKFRKPLIILAHIVVFTISLLLSFLLANNMQFKRSWLVDQYPLLLLFCIIIKLVIFGLLKQYRGWWRYVGISDLTGILGASLGSTAIIFVLWYSMVLGVDSVRMYVQDIAHLSQSIFLLDMFGTFLLLAGLRMVIRLYHEEFRAVETGRLKRFLIVGGGNAGEALLREIHRMPVVEYEVAGFVDDDPAKQGVFIHGLPVLGTVEQLPKICEDRDIEEIAIAMPSATHSEIRRVIRVCEGAKIRFRTVPSITDIASGRFKVSQIRDVDINDLLGREAVELDLESIEAFAKDKTVLVTGAGGSIGSEMCRQLCNFNPRLLLLIEQAENPLFYIERELRQRFPQVAIKAIICNITDKRRVEGLFEEYKPEVVIHAAAHKHVPLMELNPGEGKVGVKLHKLIVDVALRSGRHATVVLRKDIELESKGQNGGVLVRDGRVSDLGDVTISVNIAHTVACGQHFRIPTGEGSHSATPLIPVRPDARWSSVAGIRRGPALHRVSGRFLRLPGIRCLCRPSMYSSQGT